MKTIKIYWVECNGGVIGVECGRRWQYEAWKGNYMNISGETLEVVEVEVPEGMTYGENELFMPGLFDRSGYCEIDGNFNRPVVYAAKGEIALKVVK